MKRDFVTLACDDVTVETVVRNIELATNKPLAVRQGPFTDGVPLCIP